MSGLRISPNHPIRCNATSADNFSIYATNLLDEYGYPRATTNTVQGTATILRPPAGQASA
jgi:hypothetical protein